MAKWDSFCHSDFMFCWFNLRMIHNGNEVLPGCPLQHNNVSQIEALSADIVLPRMEGRNEGASESVWEGCYCMELDGVSLKHEHSSVLRHKALSDCCPPPPDANKQIWVNSPSQTDTHTHTHNSMHTIHTCPPINTCTYGQKLETPPIQILSLGTHTHTLEFFSGGKTWHCVTGRARCSQLSACCACHAGSGDEAQGN